MAFVIGRETNRDESGPTGRLGSYRALDGSDGASLRLDVDTPHAILVVGKRGYGKSYTLGVIAEELACTGGVAPILIDPMGVFDTLTDQVKSESVPAEVIQNPTVMPDVLDPKSWCSLLGLSPESGAGGLVWKAAQESTTVEGMKANVREATAADRDVRSAHNHLSLADSWDVFDSDGLNADTLSTGKVTVVDVSGHDDAPMNAICRGVGNALYRARLSNTIDRLPWLLVDEAHAFFGGVANETLQLLLTRGRAPGVSLVTATQRPSAIPAVGISQSDILISHRLTAQSDLAALESAKPTYLQGEFGERMPTTPGDVVIIDDATETVHGARIRNRKTSHGGKSPRASTAMRN
ncbi:ATP-binding protein [Halovenus rubra]|uniref:ATP-binding protein n=2 Tax=Halovenus rubra TaxID=869890 RepID=A0ACC7E1K0_9EURY|nr:DUF87 domain-containing protein [Halovenus rubra]